LGDRSDIFLDQALTYAKHNKKSPLGRFSTWLGC
jgi:hypothetical protein